MGKPGSSFLEDWELIPFGTIEIVPAVCRARGDIFGDTNRAYQVSRRRF